jgi:leucyl aminopeptidase (aminopeptidase T)
MDEKNQVERTEEAMRASAELLVDTCFEVTEGDVVTIITDDRRKDEAEMVATVVSERGGWPVVMNNDTQVRRALADTHFPMAPPRNLHTAMVTADDIIIMTNLEWANRFAHTKAVKESVANNARIGSVEEGFGLWPISVSDIQKTTANAEAAVALLEGKKWVRITSPGGTEVEVNLDGRPALCMVPVKKPGVMMAPVPLWGEVAFAAHETSTNGRVVVDGNMLGIGVPGHVSAPITWHVEGGDCKAIEGGEDAQRLKDTIQGVPNIETVAEFAFGTSDFAPLGSPSEKGRKGTAHFALGDNENCYPGGQNVSPLHLDGVSHNVSIQIVETGEYIVKEGVWQL